ncbi:heavy metal-associated isoprenylated plant protein 42 [Prunus persica]|uniref:heavy metal-associated isoprenylated plant protein 42 n=1 Tax=Prunus persica TaxID=3760 RepID=UPI0009AB78E8|nr:heavy metal-associated isoprenylated plant protein 42 [Prunus persica]
MVNILFSVHDFIMHLARVEDINIDPEQGLLKVSGDIDPMVLTNIVKNMDKKAELWSFQKEPYKNNVNIGASTKYNIQIGEDCSCDGDEAESSSDDESKRSIAPKKQHGVLTWAKNDKKKKNGKGFSGMGMGMGMPMPPQHRPPMRPSMGIPAHRSFHGMPGLGYWPPNPFYQPMAYHRSSPSPYGYYGQIQPPPYSYFQSRSPPKVNPIVHYTNYADNYRYPM